MCPGMELVVCNYFLCGLYKYCVRSVVSQSASLYMRVRARVHTLQEGVLKMHLYRLLINI